jgi:hypothetical protein
MANHDTFYKYMSVGTGRAVLMNKTLRWSTPGILNDPFDIQFDLNFEINRAVVKTATLQKLWDAYNGHEIRIGNALGVLMAAFRQSAPGWTREKFERELALPLEESFDKGEARLPEINAQVREQMARSKVLCLTTTFDNMLMWAHYAEAHQGLVLRFRNIPELDSPYRMARPIQYLENMPVLMDDEFISDMLSGRISFDPASIMNRLIYTKSSDWAYENEWRIFSGGGRNRDAPYEDCPFGARELDAVIFGCRMSGENKNELIALARNLYPHTQFFQMRQKAAAFKLEMVPVEGL